MNIWGHVKAGEVDREAGIRRDRLEGRSGTGQALSLRRGERMRA